MRVDSVSVDIYLLPLTKRVTILDTSTGVIFVSFGTSRPYESIISLIHWFSLLLCLSSVFEHFHFDNIFFLFNRPNRFLEGFIGIGQTPRRRFYIQKLRDCNFLISFLSAESIIG
jgi:hypothetical protein